MVSRKPRDWTPSIPHVVPRCPACKWSGTAKLEITIHGGDDGIVALHRLR
jgi:hypothetical protein